MLNEKWRGGYSSAGRAPALQAGCQRFKSAYLHQRKKKAKSKANKIQHCHSYESRVRMLEFKTSVLNLENCIKSRNDKPTGGSKEKKEFIGDRAKN
jgi:hypothetical protein